MTTLAGWLRDALDTQGRKHVDVHRCEWGDYWIPEDGPCKPARTAQAHREILDLHATCHQCVTPGGSSAWIPPDESCWSLRSIARIYRDHPGFDPSWMGES